MDLFADELNNILISVFWIGIIKGRFIYSYALKHIKIRLEVLLVSNSIIATVVYLILISINTNDYLRILLLFILCMLLSPMFPIGVSIIDKYTKHKQLMISIFIAVAGIGGSLGSAIIKNNIDNGISYSTTFLILFLLSCISAFYINIQSKKIKTPLIYRYRRAMFLTTPIVKLS